jgi:hypothetical protein
VVTPRSGDPAGNAPANPLAQPRRRLVLLGASNLARGIATALATARGTWNEPLDVLAALGHGRSYGMRSMFVGRSLPGILECQLWNDLAARPPLSTAALITDVGNDIVYGVPAEKIFSWLGECVNRLQQHRCAIAITSLPLGSLAKMTPREFFFFRNLFYPQSSLTFSRAVEQAKEVDAGLRRLACAMGIALVEPDAAWYGRDRIHIRRCAQPAAWQAFFSTWPKAAEMPPMPLATLREFLRVRAITPYRRWVFGIAHGRRQPAATLRGGLVFSLY